MHSVVLFACAVLFIKVTSGYVSTTNIEDVDTPKSGIFDGPYDDIMENLKKHCPKNPYLDGQIDMFLKFKEETRSLSTRDLASMVFDKLGNGDAVTSLGHNVILKGTENGFNGTDLAYGFYKKYIDILLLEFVLLDMVRTVIGPMSGLTDKMKRIADKANKEVPIDGQALLDFKDLLDCFGKSVATQHLANLFPVPIINPLLSFL